MAPTWIWQQSDWPQFRWDAERLQPLLDQAHQGVSNCWSGSVPWKHPWAPPPSKANSSTLARCQP